MILKANEISKSYKGKKVVNKVSVQVSQGEIVGLLGPNGAGKTTSFYMIVGIIKPEEGEIYLDNERISSYPMYKRAQSGIGYLAQEPSVFRKLSVEENILSILQFTELSKGEQKERTESLMEEFGLTHLRNNRGDLLSGGERRRTEIARALATDPKFLLLDEPFAGVDPIAVEDIQSIISILKKKNIGILITDHNVQETLAITDKTYLMFEGKILLEGVPEKLAEDEMVRKIYLGKNFNNFLKTDRMCKTPKIIYRLILLLFIMTSSVSGQFHQELVNFESANPFSLSDIITALDEQEKQRVFGQLTIPIDSLNPDKKYPLIIGVAGSMGWRKHHLDYIKMYQEQGFATFELNSFKSRGITSTVGSQDQVTIAAVILDAYRALETLAQHSYIDKDRVAITGWSLGGGVTLFSGWEPLKNVITTELSFAAHLAFYPPCFINPENLSFTKAPIHILIGEDDNWTPASPCENLVNKLSENTNIGITMYPDAHHGFDSEEPVHRIERAYSFKDCLFNLTAEGDVLMNYLRLPMSNPILQKVGFLFCVERGVDIGGNPEARKKSLTFAKNFMKRVLLTP